MRQALKMTAIARLKMGPFMVEAVYLEPNDDPWDWHDPQRWSARRNAGHSAGSGGAKSLS